MLHGALPDDPETEALIGEPAALAAMVRVEAALAAVQGEIGTIPEGAARAIAALDGMGVRPEVVAGPTASNAVPIPALVAHLREQLPAEAADWLHHGATSQDIMDSALCLQLAGILDLAEARLRTLLVRLAGLAETHAETPMLARTWGQSALATAFGAVAAGWGRPLEALLEELPDLRRRALRVSLAGAAGTLSAMPEGPATRAALAARLALADPGAGWHAERSGIALTGQWIGRALAALGRIGEDVTLLARGPGALLRLEGAGGSSTMPQKQNPTGAALIAALARVGAALEGALTGAMVHREARDGAAWAVEWLVLPDLCRHLGRALLMAQALVESLRPDPDAMAAELAATHGTIFAEALTFALAADIGRTGAAREVKALVARAGRDSPLPALAAARWPDRDLGAVFDPARQLGVAPEEARAFAARWSR